MDIVFALAAGVAIGSGILVVSGKNPIYSALSLLLCFISFAVLYLKLDAPFLAAIHVLVYTGAILVLFLFVIMLLNLGREELGPEYPPAICGLLALTCLGLFVLLAIPLAQGGMELDASAVREANGFGAVEQVGTTLFTQYGFAFELMSILILAALFGGVALAKRNY